MRRRGKREERRLGEEWKRCGVRSSGSGQVRGERELQIEGGGRQSGWGSHNGRGDKEVMRNKLQLEHARYFY